MISTTTMSTGVAIDELNKAAPVPLSRLLRDIGHKPQQSALPFRSAKAVYGRALWLFQALSSQG
jgi:hypothetical protein